MHVLMKASFAIGLMLAPALASGQTAHSHADSSRHPHATAAPAGRSPALPGQDAFGAMQEIVLILQADHRTDWSKVSLDRLRAHLIDMHEVTINAGAIVAPISGGIQATVTGAGRTGEAIRRMVPAHAHEINGRNGWRTETTELPNGVVLLVTSDDARQAEMIRGLGFFGVMATGSHHQRHHLAMARGEFAH